MTLRALLADPSADARIDRAVIAAGLPSPAALLDLLSASGRVALEATEDPLTVEVTLADLGQDLDHDLRAGHVRFEDLAPVQQDAVLGHRVAVLGETPQTIATTLGVRPSRVTRVLDEVLARRGDRVVQASREHVVGRLVAAAELASSKLREEGNWAGFWRIEKELATKLEDLGVVKRAAVQHEHHVSVGLDDARRKELAALLELERKQERRRIEVTVAAAPQDAGVDSQHSPGQAPSPRG